MVLAPHSEGTDSSFTRSMRAFTLDFESLIGHLLISFDSAPRVSSIDFDQHAVEVYSGDKARLPFVPLAGKIQLRTPLEEARTVH